jgi:hypothetical protein
MIKVIEYPSPTTANKVYTLFADTKTEVPSTGEDTAEAAGVKKLAAGSVIYTAKLAVAVLKSNDRWDWGD